MNKINPFQPNSPVNYGMFVGRIPEVLELEKGLHQTKNGYSSNFLVTGERGIGKSSLLMFLKHVSTGCYESLEQGKFNFATVNVVVSDKTDLGTFITLIEKALSREIGKIEATRKFLKDTWEFVQRIKIMDSGIDKATRESDAEILIADFSYSLAQTVKRITNAEQKEDSKDGIVFLIDEADSACSDLRLGYFLKAVTEQLQHHECNNVMFVLAGLPNVVEKLSSSHESSVRIFNQLKIRELIPEDRKLVIEKGIIKGNEINTEQTSVTEKAKSQISILSEGYPHFIQQFGKGSVP